MPKLDLSFSANFLQQTPDIKLSGNLDPSLFPQLSAGKLRSYAFWKFRSDSRPQIFPGKPQISRSLEI